VLIALSLLMKTILPHPRSFMPDRYMRLRRTPLSTFTSKNLRQSSSVIWSNGFGSKMPRLFTRISTDVNFVPSRSAACGVARSPTNPSIAALGTDPRISDRAADTDASVRPLMTTRAPSRARAVAMAIACHKSNVAKAPSPMICCMRQEGSSAELEHRRLLAVRRVLEGESTVDLADFLEVDVRSVQRWMHFFRKYGWEGLISRPVPGRPRKLSPTQEKIVLRWLQDCPTQFGFPTELWTCRRLAQLIREEWDISFNPRYLPRWLREHDFTPQKPQRVPRERDPDEIQRWLATEWPRIKKKRFARWRTWFCSMKVGS
jgi:transposase